MASVFTVENLAGIVFWVLVGATAAGAMLATNARRLIRAVAGLALCLIGVAGLYYFLSSPFLAVMQMLIYVGAVCVTIVFAVMLADQDDEERASKKNPVTDILAFAVGGLLFIGLAFLGSNKGSWPVAAMKNNAGGLTEIGNSLLTSYSMVFELISVVLLLAIIGALVLARTGRDKV